jgi:hypothetical protein
MHKSDHETLTGLKLNRKTPTIDRIMQRTHVAECCIVHGTSKSIVSDGAGHGISAVQRKSFSEFL